MNLSSIVGAMLPTNVPVASSGAQGVTPAAASADEVLNFQAQLQTAVLQVEAGAAVAKLGSKAVMTLVSGS